MIGLGINPLSEELPNGVQYQQYMVNRGNTFGIHDHLLDLDSKLIRGEACAQHAIKLRDKGFNPELICAHVGWGEALFLKDIWPNSPMIAYQEFFYNATGFDLGFDPEFSSASILNDIARARFKTLNPLLMLEVSDWNITPTRFQKSTYPLQYHPRISVIHDGIDTQLAQPNLRTSPLKLDNGLTLSANQSIVTFVNRNLEPYRGCHSFIRSIPYIQDYSPGTKIVVVGSPDGTGYGAQSGDISWRDTFLAEITDCYDPALVHFVGCLDYLKFIHLLQLSSCHVYLTYPFVLSWSLLEAMSIGCAIVGSSTAPVQELIVSGHNGLLVDFFSPKDISRAVATILQEPDLAFKLGKNARESILAKYSIEKCLPLHLSLMQLVASGGLT
ncbi:Glycosyltransferase [Prochlorococcus marinus str. MIT 9303]|uniref:Glycosyltransferase n=1 Tax=Prochlorococcus marinus (strain MIT 9303) TaxID=59922 RepID=A2C5X2_PROM3|nr:Glycosyltransferase [Prochlorococcus marinus str. MIT 9303]